MSHTLIIENHVLESDLDTIRDFFENYQLAKIDTIEYNNDDLNAIVTLDGWYDTGSARNMYDRIVDHGEAKIVYDDPLYFTVKFYANAVIDAVIDAVVVKEEKEEKDEEEQEEEEEEYEESVDERDEYIARENDVYEYLEDDVIDNANNIETLFEMVEKLQLHIASTNKNVTTVTRSLGNIRKKTTCLYKNRTLKPAKRSIWNSRLRPRV